MARNTPRAVRAPPRPRARALRAVALLQVLLLGSRATVGGALKHELTIVQDDRALFSVEPFGFDADGVAELKVHDFVARSTAPGGKLTCASAAEGGCKMGFLLRRTESISSAEATLEEARGHPCDLWEGNGEAEGEGRLSEGNEAKLTIMSPEEKLVDFKHVVSADKAGMYHLLFVRCEPASTEDARVQVSFRLEGKMYNRPGPNYLSAGQTPLPTFFMLMSFIFLGAMVAWVRELRSSSSEKVHRVHHVMTALVFFKVCSLFAESLKFHFLATRGEPIGWNVVYYFFHFLKGTFLFAVVLLIGTGWSMMKPFLNQRERRIMMFVLPAQVLDNIALVVYSERAPGSRAFMAWQDVFILVDIVCCCAILFPIVWQIRALRAAAGVDGAAERNLQRLTQFRQFYMIVVSYIYFTRIIVFLLGATLPYRSTWLQFFFAELATLAFFSFTGYKFRPASLNPYIPLRTNDDAHVDDEFGLDDSDDEAEATRDAPTKDVNVDRDVKVAVDDAA